MRDACQKHAHLKLEIYKNFDQSERAKEVMESALERYSYWLKKVNQLENNSVPRFPNIRLKDRINEDRCPCYDDDYFDEQL